MTRTFYTCPRCGYKTIQKNSIRRHLHHREKLCPPIACDIDLTDLVKQSVLDNHVYNVPQASNPLTVINQQINYYNHINNFLNQMDPLEKLQKYLKHTNTELIGFDDHVTNTFENEIEALDNEDDDLARLDRNALLNIIDTVTTVSSIDAINIIYDGIANKIKIYNEGSWKSCLLDAGIQEVIQCIKDSYLDCYECHLLRRFHRLSNAYRKAIVGEYLEEYYRFLASLDLIPFVVGHYDGLILGNSDNVESSIEDTWYPRYQTIKDNLKMTDIKTMKFKISDIIKRNTKCNLLDLNKTLMELIKVDDPFKNEVLNHIQCLLDQENLS